MKSTSFVPVHRIVWQGLNSPSVASNNAGVPLGGAAQVSAFQVRELVFETNSSSSHALALGRGEVFAEPFAKEVVREGVLTVSLDQYGWEYARYRTVAGKLRYLLTQCLQGKKQPSEWLITEWACEESEEAARLLSLVKAHTGVRIEISAGEGSAADGAEGTGLELFAKEDADIIAFLMDPTAYIETGNDNYSPPWLVQTDMGHSEPYYQHLMEEAPENFVAVSLLSLGKFGPEYLVTEAGGVLSLQEGLEASGLLREFLSSAILHSYRGYSENKWRHADEFMSVFEA